LARACFAFLLSYLTYILYLNKEKRVVCYAFVAYITIMLISTICATIFKFSPLNAVFVILGFTAYAANIFLFIQVFRIKRNAFKSYYVSMVLIFFTLFIVKVLAPVVIGLNTSNTMEPPLLLGQVNKVTAIINLLVPLSILLILTRIQKQLSESKVVNQSVV
jgi:positive regulator of sigma E activity